jgi:VIT1/CCC1 family predicted Fe2+/Mn2+ transporter
MALKNSKYLRNFVFGVEDSLVSTVGLLSGVAVADTETKTIILAGVVLIFVEAFSMGVGSLLSDNVEVEFQNKKDISLAKSGKGGLIMFVSYFISGFIPLVPYLIFETREAFWVSIILSLIALFFLGTLSATISKTNKLKQGIEMCLIGGLAIGLGVSVGSLVNGL